MSIDEPKAVSSVREKPQPETGANISTKKQSSDFEIKKENQRITKMKLDKHRQYFFSNQNFSQRSKTVNRSYQIEIVECQS